ncbi:MAG TPA: hypothetical protein PLY93_09755 [Turneriella sp.]|nr:hypothetical protein [Turneriella sp.]
MAIDAATKSLYNERIGAHKAQISEHEKEIAAYKKAMTANKKLKPFFHLGNVAQLLDIIRLQIEMNEVSEQMMQVKNNSFLDNARKNLYKIFADLDVVVKGDIDEPIDFNRTELDKITPFTPKQRLNLYRHLRRSIDKLIESYGTNTKWLWSFPELYAKSANLGKNLIDFREVQSKRDPRETYFYDRKEMVQKIIDDLMDASNRYRDKYEISTKATGDLIMAIKLLDALRRVAVVVKDDAMAAKAKTGIDSYKARIEAEKEEKKAPVRK